MELWTWLESTAPARTIGESVMLTAGLSALHAVGFTLVMSGAVVWNLSAAGLLLSRVPLKAVVRPARWVLFAGLAISLSTGLLQFAPRASYTVPGTAFRLKMLLIVVAVGYQLTVNRLVPLESAVRTGRIRAAGAIGVLLWISLALTACWFILFE
jgi:uncharacterized membrane protein YhhN